jgi:HK97 family phage prohead protease
MTRRHSAPRIVKFLGVGERQIRVVASDGTVDRMGDILVPYGVDLTNYRRNAIVLAQHDASQPIARCASIGVEGNAVVALIDFPPAGVSDRSDEYLRLMKAGVLGAVSVGFLPLKQEPIGSTGGWKFTQWELLELSVVSVPANPSALVTERSFTGNSLRATHMRRVAALKARLASDASPSNVMPPGVREDIAQLSAKADAIRLDRDLRQSRAAAIDAAARGASWW